MIPGKFAGLIELSFVFGLFMAFCVWQIRSLNRLDREDAKHEEENSNSE